MPRARVIWWVMVLGACAPVAQPRGGVAPLPPPYDLVISGGRIVDGTGAAWFYGDLAIRGDRIARVTPAGMLRDAAARERLDARGLVVAPGFIDIQGQSGGSFLFGDGRDVSPHHSAPSELTTAAAPRMTVRFTRLPSSARARSS